MSMTNSYKFLVRDIYTNEKREFEYQSNDKDPRIVHKEALKQIKYEEDIEKVYTNKSNDKKEYSRLVYGKRKGFLD